MGIFFVICGGIAIIAGIKGKEFYSADIIALQGFKQKSSKWSGRLVFIIAGVLLLALGIMSMVGVIQ
jgi:hypothetical protein